MIGRARRFGRAPARPRAVRDAGAAVIAPTSRPGSGESDGYTHTAAGDGAPPRSGSFYARKRPPFRNALCAVQNVTCKARKKARRSTAANRRTKLARPRKNSRCSRPVRPIQANNRPPSSRANPAARTRAICCSPKTNNRQRSQFTPGDSQLPQRESSQEGAHEVSPAPGSAQKVSPKPPCGRRRRSASELRRFRRRLARRGFPVLRGGRASIRLWFLPCSDPPSARRAPP